MAISNSGNVMSSEEGVGELIQQRLGQLTCFGEVFNSVLNALLNNVFSFH